MSSSVRPAILVHGGAGAWPPRYQAGARAGCRAAAQAGWEVLEQGGSALDAVQGAVQWLEDDPRFNAGTGSVLTRAGTVEMDAAIMDGRRLAAGAVGAVRRVRNPVLLARAILDDGAHVFLTGSGAEAFARDRGLPSCPEAELIVPRQHARWVARFGTVGCVALDVDGGLAAATSTGGVFAKAPGRVGDSACIGCGTLADETLAVSCTGSGEAIIRVVLAARVRGYLLAGATPGDAARRAIGDLGTLTAQEAGLIAVDSRGRLGRASNAPGMPVAWRVAGQGLLSAL